MLFFIDHLQTRIGTVRPFGIKSAVEARLHVRVANIGHPSDGPKGKLGELQLLFFQNGLAILFESRFFHH